MEVDMVSADGSEEHVMTSITLADAGDVWQSGRDGGSTPIRAAARRLTGVPHYFDAAFIRDLDAAAERDLASQTRARLLIEAVAEGGSRDAAEWRRTLHVDGVGFPARGLQPKPGADEQILELISAPEAVIRMPLWGFSLSPGVAESYGARFTFRLHGAFFAVAAWVHSGVKAEELELIGSGAYRVLATETVGGSTTVDLEQVSLLPIVVAT